MRVLFRLVAFLVVVFLLIPKAWGQAQVFPQWTARFHRTNAQVFGAPIAVDAQGNSYVALDVCLDVTLGCPDRESLTLKYDADGHLQWKAWLSSPVHQCTSVGVATDAVGNAYVLSVLWLQPQGTDSEFATAKYTPNGTRSWIQFFHGRQERTCRSASL